MTEPECGSNSRYDHQYQHQPPSVSGTGTIVSVNLSSKEDGLVTTTVDPSLCQTDLDSAAGFSKVELLQSGVDFVIDGDNDSSIKSYENLRSITRKVLVQLDVKNSCAFITLLNDQTLSAQEVNGVCDLLESQKIFNQHSSCYVVSVPTAETQNDDIYDGGAIFLAEGHTPEDQVLVVLKPLSFMKDELRSVLASKSKSHEEEIIYQPCPVEVTGAKLAETTHSTQFISASNGSETPNNVDSRGISVVDTTGTTRKRIQSGCILEYDATGANVELLMITEGSDNGEEPPPPKLMRAISGDAIVASEANCLIEASTSTSFDETSLVWTSKTGCQESEEWDNFFQSRRKTAQGTSFESLELLHTQLTAHEDLRKNNWACTIAANGEGTDTCLLHKIDFQSGVPVVSHSVQVLPSGHVRICIGCSPHTKSYASQDYRVHNLEDILVLLNEVLAFLPCAGVKDPSVIRKNRRFHSLNGRYFSKKCKGIVRTGGVEGNACHACKLAESCTDKLSEYLKLDFETNASSASASGQGAAVSKSIYSTLGSLWTSMKLNDKVKQFRLLSSRNKR